MRTLLTRTIDLVAGVTNDPHWDTPWRDSRAGQELAEEESRPDRPSGSWPWLGALMIARMALQVAAEEAKGLLAVLGQEATSYAADVLCRAVLESSSLAWWLLDPDIDADRRVARCLAYRLSSAQQTLKAIQHLVLDPDEDPSEYGELPDDVVEEIEGLGLTWSPRGAGGRPVCADESCPSYTERVSALIGQFSSQQKIPYAFLSAVSHGEVLGLTRSLVRRPNEKTKQLFPDAHDSAFWIWHDVYLMIGALTFSADRAASFLDLDEQREALEHWMKAAPRALSALRPEH